MGVQNLPFFFAWLYIFLINTKFIFLCMSFNDAQWKLQKKVWFRAKNSAKNNFLPLSIGNLFSLNISLSLFLSQKLPMNVRKKFDFQQAMSIKSGAKTNNLGGRWVQSWPNVATKQLLSRTKYNKNIETLLAKQIFPFLFDTSFQNLCCNIPQCGSTGNNRNIGAKNCFYMNFSQEVDWCIKDCDKERLQTTAFINVWKIFPGYTGDWFDVKTALTCTTELWDALKSFILDSLKIKGAPHPITVSLDTLRQVLL